MSHAFSPFRRLSPSRIAASAILASVVAISLASAPLHCPAADDAAARAETVKVLRKLAADIQANGAKLKTWSAQGELIEGRRGREGEAPWIETKVKVHFECDLVGDRLHTIYETIAAPPPREFTDPSGTRFTAHYETLERHVLVGDAWIKAEPAPTVERTGEFRRPRGAGVNSAWRRTRREADTYMSYSTVVEPRRLFLCYSGDRTFDQGLTGWADGIEQGKSLPLEITTTAAGEGQLYSLRQSFRSGDVTSKTSLIVETTYDSAFRHLPVHKVMMSPEGIVWQQEEWAYESVADVLIPFSYQLVKYERDETHAEELSREFTWDEMRVNEPLDEAWFGWSQLGLVEGDQIRDEVEGKVYRFSQGQPVAADSYPPPTNTPNR